MNITKLKYVGTSSTSYTENKVYDVLGWAANSSTEPLAIIVADNGETHTVPTKDSASWDLETVVAVEVKTII